MDQETEAPLDELEVAEEFDEEPALGDALSSSSKIQTSGGSGG